MNHYFGGKAGQSKAHAKPLIILAVGFPLILVVGCSNDVDSSRVPQSASETPSVGPAEKSEWALTESSSAFDGKTLTATKTYKSPATNSSFVVELECMQAKKTWSLKVSSFAGDMTEKNPDSAFRTGPSVIGSRVLEGRAKFGNAEPVPLPQLFHIGTYRNEIAIPGTVWPTDLTGFAYLRKAYAAANGLHIPTDYDAKFMRDPGGWNYASVVEKLLPLALEVENGNGKAEFVIEPSNEITEVLASCGGSDLPYDQQQAATEMAKLQAQLDAANEEKAQVEAESAARAQRNQDFITCQREATINNEQPHCEQFSNPDLDPGAAQRSGSPLASKPISQMSLGELVAAESVIMCQIQSFAPKVLTDSAALHTPEANSVARQWAANNVDQGRRLVELSHEVDRRTQAMPPSESGRFDTYHQQEMLRCSGAHQPWQ